MQELNNEAIPPASDIISPMPALDFSDLISSLDEKLETLEIPSAVNTPSIETLIINIETVVADSHLETASSDIEVITENIQAIEQSAESEAISEPVIEEIKEIQSDDFLKMIESITPESLISISNEPESIDNGQDKFNQEIAKINSERKHRKITGFVIEQAKFLANYIIVSVVVFFVLLGAANYTSYSTIAYNYINPDNLKNSSKEILNVIDNSKIKVFADEDISLLGKEQQNTMQKTLAEDNAQLRDTYFSPKKLVPLKSNVNLTVDIMPYENRIIIPKIGKNIPLVDVDSRRGNLDFVNLEEIFMSELEKGVLRYPGTAKPGENGVAFIFGHSSNYPWLKGEYNAVFAMLDNLVTGDEIIVYYNQKKYTYVINEKKVIKPGNLKILERDPTKKELSLMTCWPIGTSLNRLITFAELKSVN